MSPRSIQRRGRALASLTAVMGLALTTAAVTTGPAISVAPTGDCAVPFPVDELAKGDAVTGLTVTSGTEPEGFTGEVLGVLDDGINLDLDMVLVELSSAEIDRVGGIWQGMSGSPVYAADGRLIGAVAYGLSWGPSPVAGVTPFADMDDYLAATDHRERIPVGKAVARTIADRTDVTAAQAEQGFRQLPMPLGVSGVSNQRLAQDFERSYLPRAASAVGKSTAAAAAGPESIVAGGNIAASMSYGDITQAGIGTATSVCGDRVVGFGHPMAFLGETSMTLHPADAIYVQADSVAPPFKVANLGAPAGTITDDHLTGITGFFGALPDTTVVSSSVAYADRSRTGASQVSVPSATAATTFYQLLANHDRVIDGILAGSEVLSWTITGTDEAGAPFELSFTDRHTSRDDITFEASFDLADLVWALSAIPGVELESVTADSQVTKGGATLSLGKLEQYRNGTWARVDRHHPAIARAGKKLVMRAALRGPDGTSYVPYSFAVPKRASRSMGFVFVAGGGSLWSEGGGSMSSIAQAKKAVDSMVRNDELVIAMRLSGRRTGSTQEMVAGPAENVVEGMRRVQLFVR